LKNGWRTLPYADFAWYSISKDAHHFKDHAPRADTFPAERIEFIASLSLAINNGFCKTGRSLYAS
jgi:hypothetical protein